MKHLVFTLLAALLVSGAASAQRLMVGVRGGVNFTDYSFVPTRIGDIRFSPGSPRAGYDVGFVLRLNLSKHLHLQSELDYAFVNYSVRAGDAGNRRLTLRTERFEIPVQLGFQFGVLRLFGGALPLLLLVVLHRLAVNQFGFSAFQQGVHARTPSEDSRGRQSAKGV